MKRAAGYYRFESGCAYVKIRKPSMTETRIVACLYLKGEMDIRQIHSILYLGKNQVSYLSKVCKKLVENGEITGKLRGSMETGGLAMFYSVTEKQFKKFIENLVDPYGIS